jgi:protein gp37
MADQRSGGISWTEETWNPIVGCRRVSPGCQHCYAEVLAARVANAAQAGLRAGKRLTSVQSAYRQVVMWERGKMDAADSHDVALPKWNGRLVLIRDRVNEPLTWTRPRLVFVNSMSDLFYPSLLDEQIDRIVSVMSRARHHTFQVLTKRPERMASYLNDPDTQRRIAERNGGQGLEWPLPNVWWGTSAENQEAFDQRIDHLVACRKNAAVLWLSLEPLIGPVTLTAVPDAIRAFIDWVVVGGESGAGARVMGLAWVRQLRDECAAAGIPFHFKQWGAWYPYGDKEGQETITGASRIDLASLPVVHYHLVGKKAAGRLLDGVLHDAMPRTSR